jgi:hypothetical protein
VPAVGSTVLFPTHFRTSNGCSEFRSEAASQQ